MEYKGKVINSVNCSLLCHFMLGLLAHISATKLQHMIEKEGMFYLQVIKA